MSNLPVKQIYFESNNSTTGRRRCFAAIIAGAKGKLIVATCHHKRSDLVVLFVDLVNMSSIAKNFELKGIVMVKSNVFF